MTSDAPKPVRLKWFLGFAGTQWVNCKKNQNLRREPVDPKKRGHITRARGLAGLKSERLGLKAVLGVKKQPFFNKNLKYFECPCTAGAFSVLRLLP